MNKDLEYWIIEKMRGLEVAIETEQAVVDHLSRYNQPFKTYMDQPWQDRLQPVNEHTSLLSQQMRQFLASRDDLRRFKEEYQHFANIRILVEKSYEQKGNEAPVQPNS